jgi:surface antigen
MGKTAEVGRHRSAQGERAMKKSMKVSAIALAVSGALALSACSTTEGWGTKQTIGTAAGAIGGGLLGAQFGGGTGQLIMTGLGALAGAYVGNEIGASLDRADQQAMHNAAMQATSAPVGNTITRNNPDSGNHGAYTVTQTGQLSSGEPCREFERTVYAGGRESSETVVLCKVDGEWREYRQR